MRPRWTFIFVIFTTLSLGQGAQAATQQAQARALSATSKADRDPALIALALGSQATRVIEAYSLGYSELLTWTLLLIQKDCACDFAVLVDERRTRSWGVVAQAHGLDWEALMSDLDRRLAAAHLVPAPPTPAQILANSANRREAEAEDQDEEEGEDEP